MTKEERDATALKLMEECRSAPLPVYVQPGDGTYDLTIPPRMPLIEALVAEAIGRLIDEAEEARRKADSVAGWIGERQDFLAERDALKAQLAQAQKDTAHWHAVANGRHVECRQAKAAEIERLRAINADLVAALEAALITESQAYVWEEDAVPKWAKMAEAALAKARGES